jgi:probable F420-dependent oxidoreductase
MKVGLSFHRPHLLGPDPAVYAAVARWAERLGYESVWVCDHLVLPETVPDTYPYAEGGLGSLQGDFPVLDPMITLTYLAAATETILLGTDIYILPLRDVFVSAKAVATLDILSTGRTLFGVGVGWCGPEFAAAGLDFHNRGRRCDELIDAIKLLWTEATIDFRGTYYSFGPVKFEPKPVQRPHPPIHYGGNSAAALRRAAERCDGWISAPQSLEAMAAAVSSLRDLRCRFERDHLPFEVTRAITVDSTREDLLRLEELGVDRVTVNPWREAAEPIPLGDALGQMERMAKTLGLPVSG